MKIDVFSATTYADVHIGLKQQLLHEYNFDFLPENQRKKALALHKIQNLESWFNQGWTPNWNDSSEYKYYPYFWFYVGGGWSFSSSYDHYSYSYGQPAFYKNKKISDFIGNNKEFKQIYIDFITG